MPAFFAYIPPPPFVLVVVVLSKKEQLVIVGEFSEYIPPPKSSAKFPLKTQLIILGVPLTMLATPPPFSVAILSATIKLTRVELDALLLIPAPFFPLLFFMIKLERVGED